jgi:hypothetical protein
VHFPDLTAHRFSRSFQTPINIGNSAFHDLAAVQKSNDGVEHDTVQLKFASLGAMVSRHAAPIAAHRELGGSIGNFKLSRISAAAILKSPSQLDSMGIALQEDRLRSPIECLEGRHGEESDAQQQRKEEAQAGQEQEERRRSDVTVQTRLLVRQPIRQEALVYVKAKC